MPSKSNRRGYMGSTEPGARKVREKIEKTRNPPKRKPSDMYNDPYDNLISSSEQKEATEEGLLQLRKLREGQRKRREALEKQRKRQTKEKTK